MAGSKDSKVRPPNPRQLGLTLKGTFYICPDLPGKPCALYTFQKTGRGHGNLPGYKNKDQQMRRWVKPRDPKTPAQILRRNIFRAAVMRWHQMSLREQSQWHDIRAQPRISALNNWMRYALQGGLRV